MSLAIKTARVQTQGSGRVMPGIGDPGLFGFLGSVGRVALGAAGAGIAAAASRIFKPGVGAVVSNGQVTTRGSFFQETQQAGPPKPGVQAAFERFFPGGETGRFEVNGNGMRLACPTGFHPNKSAYFTKGGADNVGFQFIEKGSKCVKNRRRNPLNARAADRAISRIESAKRATKRLGRVTIRKKC